MGWNPVVTPTTTATIPASACSSAPSPNGPTTAGTLSHDIRAEQEKLAWADTLVVQFPLWWYGMPAILKGWFDRVFVKGFAFGLTGERPPSALRRRRAGRKARHGVITAGARATAFGPRGVNGELNELLFPLLHGMFWYTGMSGAAAAARPRRRPATGEDYRRPPPGYGSGCAPCPPPSRSPFATRTAATTTTSCSSTRTWPAPTGARPPTTRPHPPRHTPNRADAPRPGRRGSPGTSTARIRTTAQESKKAVGPVEESTGPTASVAGTGFEPATSGL